MKHNIKHLAIIMDGNARWAKAVGVSKAEGHKKGSEAAKRILPIAAELNIPYLTLYAFSSENWQRPEDEVSTLIKLLAYYVKTETKSMHKNGVRLKVIGNLARLPQDLKNQIGKAVELTKHNDKLTLCLAFSYGGRSEIVEACRSAMVAGDKDISEETFSKYLYDPEMPDVDLLIRTSGVLRMSNFLLWQSAYAELYFLDKCWPDFGKEDLVAAIEDYSQRTRNFGGR